MWKTPLPTPKIRLDIAIEVVGRLRLVQETRSLSDDKLYLIVTELLGNRQVALPSNPTSNHQPPLVCPVRRSSNAKSCIGRFASCKARRAPLGPSRGKAKRGSVGCGKQGGGCRQVYSTKCFLRSHVTLCVTKTLITVANPWFDLT
jgi:hypothetical protein